MWKSGTFDLEDINEALLKEIVCFDISYPSMSSSCVIFFTESGDEYIISEYGTEWKVVGEIVQLFPEIYEAWTNQGNGVKDEHGYTVRGNWKILPAWEGVILVRVDYFEKFYKHYKTASKYDKEIPCTVARMSFGRDMGAPDERMVFIKNHETREKDIQEARVCKLEVEQNRLTDEDVPWIKCQCEVFEGYIKFLARENSDGTVSVYRWFIQFQKEQEEDGVYILNPPVECYNLFLKRYENLEVSEVEDWAHFYNVYVRDCKAGEFFRSYKEVEKAKAAVVARNEKLGWGNVNKKNMYMLDYEHIKARAEKDMQLLIL